MYIALNIVILEKFSASTQWKLVAFLKHPIVLIMPLHGIVCQMNEGLVQRLWCYIEFKGRCSDIAFLEQVTLMIMCNQHPQPYVKFPSLNQQWFFQILLDYERIRLHNIWHIIEISEVCQHLLGRNNWIHLFRLNILFFNFIFFSVAKLNFYSLLILIY